MRKGLIGFIVSSMLSLHLATVTTADTPFQDIQHSYAKDAILQLVNQGILNGDGQGSFRPYDEISRQDFAIIYAKAMQLDISATPSTSTFSDVPSDNYAFPYIEAAVKAGLVSGYGDGNFGYNDTLTREQMAALFVRALGVDVKDYGNLTFSDADQISDWAKDAVAAAVELGLIHGDENNAFHPQGRADRQAVALVTNRFLHDPEVNQHIEKMKEEQQQEEEPTQSVPTDTPSTTRDDDDDHDRDNSAPIITGASINGNPIELGENGVNGEIHIYENLLYGSIQVNEQATLEITSVEGIHLDEYDSLSFAQTLPAQEMKTLQIISYLGDLDTQSDGISLVKLHSLDLNKDGVIEIKGTLKDQAGNTSSILLSLYYG